MSISYVEELVQLQKLTDFTRLKAKYSDIKRS